MKGFNKKKFLVFLISVVILLALVYLLIKDIENKRPLKVAFLDVGQGDAIYIEAPNKKQALVDGGRDRKVLREIERVMPFGDRSIDILIGTHPDSDHIGGLSYIIDRYKIGSVFEPGTTSSSKTYQSLEEKIDEKNIPHMFARSGTEIILDRKNNVVLQILYPDQDPVSWESNESSIVAMLSYGSQKVLLTGDSPIEKEEILVKSDGEDLEANILKLGHHGSRTSSSEVFLTTVDPELAIISAGKNNSYGHPHKEVIDLLDKLGIKYLETSKEGTIICKLKKTEFSCK